MDPLLKVKSFLDNNRLASLATVSGRSKDPQVAVVFYVYDNGVLYFATEKSSQKAQNIIKNKKLALAIVQEKQLELLQIEGYGEIMEDSEERIILEKIYEKLSKEDTHETWPIMKLNPKNLKVFEVTIEWFKYSNFAEEVIVVDGTAADLHGIFRQPGNPSRETNSSHRLRLFPHIRRR